jgi:thiol:disulfide interchange protein
MEDVKNNSGQNLGIAALITGIITFVLAVIPCVGLIAIIPGIIAIILAIVGLSQASQRNAPKGLLIAGLIIAVIASMISVSQFFVAGKLARHADQWPNEIQNVVRDVQENVIKDLEDANISIKVESNGDKVEINTNPKNEDKELKLEELEGVKPPKSDSLKTDTLKKKK